MRIHGGKVFDGMRFDAGSVYTAGDLIVDEAHAESGDLDARGCYVVPGLIDIHVHGCKGVDLCDGTRDALATMARYQAAHGVTALCPATMTYPEAKLAAVLANAAEYSPARDEAALVGVNMEGPFISPNKIGAQNPTYVQACDIEQFRRLQEMSGRLVKLVDVAPEEEGALAFIDAVKDEVRVSLAHTTADYACAQQAFLHGARHMTHLYNAMNPLHHREPGPIAAALECEDATVELIADGVHVHPAMVRLTFRLFGDDRVILISDAMRATGLVDGVYDLGGQDVTVKGNRAVLSDGTIAGSATNLADCLRICAGDMNVPLESAVKAATANPARAIGVFDERGSLDIGKQADIVVLDEDLTVKHVVVRGELLR